MTGGNSGTERKDIHVIGAGVSHQENLTKGFIAEQTEARKTIQICRKSMEKHLKGKGWGGVHLRRGGFANADSVHSPSFTFTSTMDFSACCVSSVPGGSSFGDSLRSSLGNPF
jgi:hypothetical protein